MPLEWKRPENPYRVNYFGIIGVGPRAPPQVVSEECKKRITILRYGGVIVVGGKKITEADLAEAQSVLLERGSRWAAEVLLVHPAPPWDAQRVRRVCRDILKEGAPAEALPLPRLGNLRALGVFLPAPCAEDIAWPELERFGLPGAEGQEDGRYDVQFDV